MRGRERGRARRLDWWVGAVRGGRGRVSPSSDSHMSMRNGEGADIGKLASGCQLEVTLGTWHVQKVYKGYGRNAQVLNMAGMRRCLIWQARRCLIWQRKARLRMCVFGPNMAGMRRCLILQECA